MRRSGKENVPRTYERPRHGEPVDHSRLPRQAFQGEGQNEEAKQNDGRNGDRTQRQD